MEARKISQALDLVSDLYLNPIFDPHEIEKEKGVVIEEINMYEDLPPRRVEELFTQLLYGDQPAGWDIAGKKEVIQSLTRDALIEYRTHHYVAEATVIVIAGNFPEDQIIREIKDHFSHIPKTPKKDKLPVHERQTKPNVFVKHKASDQSHLVLGCRAFSVFDKRRFALEVLSDVLGGGMSSRLFERVRNELGAAYYVKSSADLFTDHGYLEISAGADHKKLTEVIIAILKECKRLTTELVPKVELDRAKAHLSGRLLLGLETSDALATYYGGQEILQTPIETPEELQKKIYGVKAEEIMDVARFMFTNEKLNLALIGPYKDSTAFSEMLHF